jgi:hypothetical protein
LREKNVKQIYQEILGDKYTDQIKYLNCENAE